VISTPFRSCSFQIGNRGRGFGFGLGFGLGFGVVVVVVDVEVDLLDPGDVPPVSAAAATTGMANAVAARATASAALRPCPSMIIRT
jgi:hypothetical protein